MKRSDFIDFPYTPPKGDLSSLFSVEQSENGDGSVSTFYNLNDGMTIEGIEDIPADYVKSYRVSAGDTLKSISWKLYGSIDYWWIVAKLNRMGDAFTEFEPGARLLVVDKNMLDSIIGTVAKEV